MNKKLIILFLVIIFQYHEGFCCSCDFPSIAESFKDAKIAFHGKVKNQVIGQFYKEQGFSNVITTFEVIKGYKNITNTKGLISIVSRNSICDFIFQENEDYIVFANGSEFYYTSVCTRTHNLKKFSNSDLLTLEELSIAFYENPSKDEDVVVLSISEYDSIIALTQNISVEARPNQKNNANYIYYLIGFTVIFMTIYLITKKKSADPNE
jgi:hypothetical protein